MPGPMELVIVLIVALVIFGPRRLPELGKSLGGGMRSFKRSIEGSDEEEARQPELARRETAA